MEVLPARANEFGEKKPIFSPWRNPVLDVLAFNEESGFFAQGGAEPCKIDVLSKWDRTLTIKVSRIADVGAHNTLHAIIFGTSGDPQPAGVQVSMPDLNITDQEMVRREIMSNDFLVEGIRILFPNCTPGGAGSAGNLCRQQLQPLRIRNRNYTGKNEVYDLQTLNHVSPTNGNTLVIDVPLIGVTIDSESEIIYPILQGEEVYFFFTLKARQNMANMLFGKYPLEVAEAPRTTGNPIYDFVIERKANSILESGFNSAVQYAFAPRLTGNDIADIQLLRSADNFIV